MPGTHVKETSSAGNLVSKATRFSVVLPMVVLILTSDEFPRKARIVFRDYHAKKISNLPVSGLIYW